MSIGNALLSTQDWGDYKRLLSDAHEAFSQKQITWRKQNVTINRFQEDFPNQHTDTTLLVLINYNYRRSWPINVSSETGDDDEQVMQVLINKEYLRQGGLLDNYGAFNYNEVDDRFIVDGTVYKVFGDTAAAQMQSDDVYFTIILKRIQLHTGDKR